MKSAKKHFDVIVAGAGPAGSTFAMAMQGSGLQLLVIDKAVFPRDKICGDAIPGRAVRVLESLGPGIKEAFARSDEKLLIKSSKVTAPNGSRLQLHFKTSGYTAPRMAFDHQLLQMARQNEQAVFLEGRTIKKVILCDQRVDVKLDNGSAFSAELIIGCDGANSAVARQLTGRKVEAAHHCAAVRAYYRGVRMPDQQSTEIFLLKNCLPGYFWIFPLPSGLYNVGFGMLSRDISQRKIQLRQQLEHIIATENRLQPYFSEAERVGPVEGFGLPLGSRRRPLSGARFLLAGDAASLIDPATGEGIGNAMLSAKIAANVTQDSFQKGDFSADFLFRYDGMIYAKLWKELSYKHLIQRLLKDRSRLISFLIGQASRHRFLRSMVHKTF